MPLELQASIDIAGESTINGAPLADWTAKQQYVKIEGPTAGDDKRVCPLCAPFAGNTYKEDDPRVRAWTRGAGKHPRCRHWAEPVPPEDVEAVEPGEDDPEGGSDFIDRMVNEGNAARLGDIFGPVRAKLLAERQVELAALYTKKGELKTLEAAGFGRGGRRVELAP
ncbi:MAG TPA: hypothetical protein VMW48_00220, partial [Vicinamibacterales bacterium]|nr:hypothetical protein [Vicinamibacterales bacterium]